MSQIFKKFSRFSNFQLYEYCQSREISERILELADVYLDINHWNEVDDIIGRALAIRKPIFAFDTVAHRTDEGIQVFSIEDKESMVMAIRHQLEKVDSGEKE